MYSVLFHVLMAREGREFSWLTGLYWTLTVMSTLGFGDITFTEDPGRMYSMGVLLTGLVFILILLPFSFVQLFYVPWVEARSVARAPHELPKGTSDHVVLTHYDPVTSALIRKLTQYNYPYVLLVPDVAEALRLQDLDIKVVVGYLDDPETYHRVRLDTSSLVALTTSDVINTKVAFILRGISRDVPIIATSNNPASVDILELAGCSRVLQLHEMMGQSLARRAKGGDTAAHVIGQFDQLLIAETTASETSMVGKTLEEIGLRSQIGITVVGIWEYGQFETGRPQTRISPNTVLVLAGSRAQLEKYNEAFRTYHVADAPVVIIGGGRVGRATAQALAERGLDYRIVEQLPERIRDPDKYILGNAAELEVMEKAGIMEATTAIITTHDDDTNAYLTIYCRRLRPDIQTISRVTLDRNIPTLHQAGTDFVMSYASMGANAIFNLLRRNDTLMVAEGLDVFKVKIPASLVDQTIAGASVRRETGCTVIAIDIDHTLQVNPDPDLPLPAAAEIILIGSVEAENRFCERFGTE